MATTNSKVKGLAEWIVNNFDDSEIEGLAQLLGKSISVAYISDNSVNEFLTRAEAACLRAAYQVVSSKEVLGENALRGLNGEVAARKIQEKFTKLFLDGPV